MRGGFSLLIGRSKSPFAIPANDDRRPLTKSESAFILEIEVIEPIRTTRRPKRFFFFGGDTAETLLRKGHTTRRVAEDDEPKH